MQKHKQQTNKAIICKISLLSWGLGPFNSVVNRKFSQFSSTQKFSMINWFREKLTEKRTRWRKQQSPAVSDSHDCPQTSNAEKKQKLYTKK
jgi:hypothetical protein